MFRLLPRFILFASLLFSPAFGSVFLPNDWTHTHDAALRPIGVVRTGLFAGALTGFMVSECHMMTARHAFGRARHVVGRRISFELPDSKAPERSGGTVFAAGAQAGWESDWALVRLDRCLGGRFGYLPLTERPIWRTRFWRISGNPLMSAGYPSGRSRSLGIMLDPACSVREIQHGMIRHDCGSAPGSSGSPIFGVEWHGDQPQLTVFAMQVAALPRQTRPIPFERSKANIAVSIESPAQALRMELARSPTGLRNMSPQLARA